MNSAVIISSGTIIDYKTAKNITESCDMIICADGGAEHCEKIGICPNVIIGDFDSIKPSTLEKYRELDTKIIHLEDDKDETDTQLAVEYAVENGVKEIKFLGCIGTRFDHTFANVSMLIWLMERGIRGVIMNENNDIHVIDRYIKLDGEVGDKISLLPISPKIDGIFTTGLKYALENGELFYNSPRGISNEFISTSAEIVIRDGMLLVIKSKD